MSGVFFVLSKTIHLLAPIMNQPPSVAERELGEEDVSTVKKPEEENTLGLSIPDNFNISIFADNLGKARVLTHGPGNGVLVSVMDQGKILALPDIDMDGQVDKVFVLAEGLYNPHGLLVDCDIDNNCRLYVAETNAVSVYNYYPNSIKAENKTKIIDLPDDGGHYTRTLGMITENDKNRLLISVGSSCNVCEESDWRRSSILIVDMDGSNLEIYAGGLRNAVFFATHPITGDIWATENGRDWLGDELPPDEINIIRKNQNYGWPICYGNNIHDDNYDKNKYIQNPCAGKIPAAVNLPAHSAPLGINFFGEEGWGEEYWYDALVAYHGSWNRTNPTGYKITRLKINDRGEYVGTEDFITGWLTDDSKVTGRPVDILIKPGGIIYISDDKRGVVYRLQYHNTYQNNKEQAKNPIVLDSPIANNFVASPLYITGEALGNWFFEGSFPVEVRDENNKIIATAIAQARDDWMTEAYVPFSIEVEFPIPETETGRIILKKDNPSGLKELDDFQEIPVRFRATTKHAGENCEFDSDCSLPMEFAIRSICPYGVKCIGKKCAVICPEF